MYIGGGILGPSRCCFNLLSGAQIAKCARAPGGTEITGAYTLNRQFGLWLA
jgi:hypothetical protein